MQRINSLFSPPFLPPPGECVTRSLYFPIPTPLTKACVLYMFWLILRMINKWHENISFFSCPNCYERIIYQTTNFISKFLSFFYTHQPPTNFFHFSEDSTFFSSLSFHLSHFYRFSRFCPTDDDQANHPVICFSTPNRVPPYLDALLQPFETTTLREPLELETTDSTTVIWLRQRLCFNQLGIQ